MSKDQAIAPENQDCPNGEKCKHGAWCTEVYCQGIPTFRAFYKAPEAAQPDCRTCEYMWVDIDLEKATSKESCARPGGAVCVNGSLHRESPKVVLWRTE